MEYEAKEGQKSQIEMYKVRNVNFPIYRVLIKVRQWRPQNCILNRELKLITFLIEFKSIWNSHLAVISVTKDRIDPKAQMSVQFPANI